MNQPQHSATDHSPLECKRRLMAGRAATVAAIAVFVSTYLCALAKFGLLLGIAVGWLPCGLAAWLTAVLVMAVLRHLPGQ